MSIFFVLSLSSVYADCIVPTDGMIIGHDTTLCYGVYDLPGNLTGQPAIRISTGDITLDCNDATLNGGIYGMGIVMMGGYSNVIIKNCNLNGYYRAIYATGNNNIIFNNSILGLPSDNPPYGISGGGTNFTISNNTIQGVGYGMYLGVKNSTISNNFIFNSSFNPTTDLEGISLGASSSYNLIKNNDIIRFHNGIGLHEWVGGTRNQYNIIENNNFLYTSAGVFIWTGGSLYNIIRNNNFIYSWRGIEIIEGNDNLIYHNNFIGGIYLSLNTINTWDIGYPSGGNYWNISCLDNKQGSYQNETGSDGICDNPYYLNADNKDNYPFVHEGSWGGEIPTTTTTVPTTIVTTTATTTSTIITTTISYDELVERIEDLENRTTTLESIVNSLKNYVNLIICQLLPKGLMKEVTCPVY